MKIKSYISNRTKNLKGIMPFLKSKRKNLLDYLNNKKNIQFKFFKNPLNYSIEIFNNIQDLLERKISSEKEEVILKQSPFWAKSITWTLMGGSAFGLIWLSIAKTEEIIIVQGKLEPINQVFAIQVPQGGVIQDILVKEGEIVEKNQRLIKLDTEQTISNIKTTKEILAIESLLLSKIELLSSEGAVSEVEYYRQKRKVSELKNKLLSEEILLKYQTIKTPIKGKVFDMKPANPGYVARSSEPILSIVPIDNLKAKIEIESRSIGFVKEGKLADISIDSFPASDFGVLQGKITRISSDALPPDPSQGKGYRFPAEIKLDTQYLEIKNGKKLILQPGMSLTANIKLRKVSYMQLLLGTFQDKADSLRSL